MALDSGEMLTRRPCPQRCSRGGGARWHPAGEAVEEGSRPVGEVAGVRAVLGEALLGLGGWPERPVDVDGHGGSWSQWRPVTSGRPLVQRLVGEVARSRRTVARSRRLP
jgi:hypothetical protein